MSQGCGCGCQKQAAGPSAYAGVTRDMTVARVMQVWPETAEVFKAHGVNHCCGSHLPLDQAAAAAGVALETLLRDLDAATKTPA